MIIPVAEATGQHVLYLPTQEGHDLLGLVDDDGQLLSPPIYQKIIKTVDGGFPAAVQAIDGRWGYIRHNGEVLVEPTLQQAKSFTADGIARFKKDDKWGFLKADGSYLIPPVYADVGYFSYGLAAVKNDDVWHYIDVNGKQVFDAEFADARGFNALGVAAAAKKPEGKLGFINRQGEWVVKPSYDEVRNFSRSGVAGARKDRLWGLVDSTGDWVVKPKFYQFWWFDEYGFAELRIEYSRGGIISDTGEVVIDLGESDFYELNYSGRCRVLHYQYNTPVTFYNLNNGELIDEINNPEYRLATEADDQCRMLVLHKGTGGWSRIKTDGTRYDLDEQVLEPYFDETPESTSFAYVDGKYVPVVLRDRSLAYVNYDGAIALRAETLKQESHDVIIMRDANGKELWRHQYKLNSLISNNDYPAFLNKSSKDFNYTPSTPENLREKINWLKTQEPAPLAKADKYFNGNSGDTIGAGVQLAYVNYYNTLEYWYAIDHPTLSAEFDETKSVLEKLYGPVPLDDETINQTLDYHDAYIYNKWDKAAWRLDDKVLVLERRDTYESDDSGTNFLNLLLLPTASSMASSMSLPIVPIESVTLASVTDDDIATAINEVESRLHSESAIQLCESVKAILSQLQSGKKITSFDYIRLQYVLLQAAEPEDDLFKIGSEAEAVELSKVLLDAIEKSGLGEAPLTSKGQFLISVYVQVTDLVAWGLAESAPSEALHLVEASLPYLTNVHTSSWDTYVRLLLANDQQEKAFLVLKKLFIENPWHEYLTDFYEDKSYRKWAKKNDAPVLSYDEVLTTASSVMDKQDMAVHQASGRLAVAWFNEIVMFDLTTGKKLFTVDTETYDPFVLRFSHDGSKLTASGWDSTTVWDVSNGKRLARQPVKEGNSKLAGVSANGKHYFYDQQTYLLGRVLRVKKLGSDRLRSMLTKVVGGNISPDNCFLAVGVADEDDPHIKIIDLDKADVVASLHHERADMYDDLYFIDDNKRLLGVDGSDLHLWNITDEESETSWDTGDFSVDLIAVAKELVLVVDHHDFLKRSWNFSDKPQNAVELSVPEYARGGISDLAISENKKSYALVTHDDEYNLSYVFVFDAQSDEVITEYVSDNPFGGVTFINNDRHLVLEGYPITVIEADSGDLVREITR